MKNLESENQLDYELQEAQFSMTICGLGDYRWVGYCFVDSDPEEEDTDNEDSDGEEENVAQREGADFLEDPIASGGREDATRPKGNPREYFLRVVEIRSAEVLDEWEYTVYWLEENIRQCVGWLFDFLTVNVR